jgi:hypothetical protein
MSPGEKTDPATLEWREKVCARCCQCSRLLAFMEGPMCDPCLDEDEVRPCRDKYYGVKLTEERMLKAEVAEALRSYRGESSVPPPAHSGVRLVVRDTLAVDLSCLGKVVFHRHTPKTMDTLPVGWKTMKAR